MTVWVSGNSKGSILKLHLDSTTRAIPFWPEHLLQPFPAPIYAHSIALPGSASPSLFSPSPVHIF